MALASGWKPGMNNATAASLKRPNEHIGYTNGVAYLLDKATEAEIIECMERSVHHAKRNPGPLIRR